MAGRGRGRATTLPAWMTKSGGAVPAAAPAPTPSTSTGDGPQASMPSPRKGQFDDAPPRRSQSPSRQDRRSRERGEAPPVRPAGDWGRRDAPPANSYNGSNSYSSNGNGYGYERRRSRSRDRSRDRSRGYDYRRDGRRDDRRDERYADRGYYASSSSNGGGNSSDRYESYYRNSSSSSADYRDRRDYDYRGDRRDRSPPRRGGDFYEQRGYGRVVDGPASGHDDRTTRTYSDYRR